MEEDEARIWRSLDQVLGDAGFTLWTHAYASIFRSPDRTYPLSSGFGYARTDDPDQVGTVTNLREFQFPVGLFYVSTLPLSDIYKRMGLHGLRAHEMGLMLSSALLSLETKGATI